jgi:hypothetical protein
MVINASFILGLDLIYLMILQLVGLHSTLNDRQITEYRTDNNVERTDPFLI